MLSDSSYFKHKADLGQRFPCTHKMVVFVSVVGVLLELGDIAIWYSMLAVEN